MNCTISGKHVCSLDDEEEQRDRRAVQHAASESPASLGTTNSSAVSSPGKTEDEEEDGWTHEYRMTERDRETASGARRKLFPIMGEVKPWGVVEGYDDEVEEEEEDDFLSDKWK